MDYVATVRGTNEQVRITVGFVEVFNNKCREFHAAATVVGTDEIVAKATSPSAGEACKAVAESIKSAYDNIESYQREKHRHLSLGKLVKK